MSELTEINIFRSLDFIRDNATKYAKAKAERVYLDEFRKSKKAILMRIAEEKGINVAAKQESWAYSNDEYLQLLIALRDAVAEEERLRWLIVAAQARIEAWRSLQANERIEKHVLGG